MLILILFFRALQWIAGRGPRVRLPAFLVIPYPDPNTRPQNTFNVALNRTRVKIEMTFGILKARFNCLRGI